MLTINPLPERDVGEPEYPEDPEDAPRTRTVLASQLQVGDTLVSAALGGVWDAEVLSVRIAKGEVFLRIDGWPDACLGRDEVVEIRADTTLDQRREARAQFTEVLLEIMGKKAGG